MKKDNLPATTEENRLLQPGTKVWDAELKQHHEVTEDEILRYVSLCNQLVVVEAVRCETYYQIRSQRLWRCDGFHTFRDWCETKAGIGGSTGNRLAERGEKMFLFLNAAENAGLPTAGLREALIEGPKQTRLLLLQMPADEAVDTLKSRWFKDGREYDDAEAKRILSKDDEEIRKTLKRRLDDSESKIETLTAEVEALRKIAKGDTIVAADLAQKLEKREKQLQELIGERETGERAKQEFAEAAAHLDAAYTVLFKYMPRTDDEEEWRQHGEEFGTSAGMSVQFSDKLLEIQRTYMKFREELEG